MFYSFKTTCGHGGTIKPVKAKGGKYEGQWRVVLKGPRVANTRSQEKTMYSKPDLDSAKHRIAKFLCIPLDSIACKQECDAAGEPMLSRRQESTFTARMEGGERRNEETLQRIEKEQRNLDARIRWLETTSAPDKSAQVGGCTPIPCVSSLTSYASEEGTPAPSRDNNGSKVSHVSSTDSKPAAKFQNGKMTSRDISGMRLTQGLASDESIRSSPIPFVDDYSMGAQATKSIPEFKYKDDSLFHSSSNTSQKLQLRKSPPHRARKASSRLSSISVPMDYNKIAGIDFKDQVLSYSSSEPNTPAREQQTIMANGNNHPLLSPPRLISSPPLVVASPVEDVLVRSAFDANGDRIQLHEESQQKPPSCWISLCNLFFKARSAENATTST